MSDKHDDSQLDELENEDLSFLDDDNTEDQLSSSDLDADNEQLENELQDDDITSTSEEFEEDEYEEFEEDELEDDENDQSSKGKKIAVSALCVALASAGAFAGYKYLNQEQDSNPEFDEIFGDEYTPDMDEDSFVAVTPIENTDEIEDIDISDIPGLPGIPDTPDSELETEQQPSIVAEKADNIGLDQKITLPYEDASTDANTNELESISTDVHESQPPLAPAHPIEHEIQPQEVPVSGSMNQVDAAKLIQSGVMEITRLLGSQYESNSERLRHDMIAAQEAIRNAIIEANANSTEPVTASEIELIVQNAIQDKLTELKGSFDSNEHSKNEQLVSKLESVIKKISAQVSAPIKSIQDQMDKTERENRQLAKEISEIKQLLKDEPRGNLSQLKNRKRMHSINVVNRSKDGSMSIVRTPAGKINTFFVGERFRWEGKRHTVTGIIDNGRVILIDDKFYIDETRDKAPPKPKTKKTRPVAHKVKASSVKQPDYVISPDNPNKIVVEMVEPEETVLIEAAPEKPTYLDGWVLNSVFPSGFLVTGPNGQSQVVKKGKMARVGKYAGEVMGINSEMHGLQIGMKVIRFLK